jgi:hypothetical protein
MNYMYLGQVNTGAILGDQSYNSGICKINTSASSRSATGTLNFPRAGHDQYVVRVILNQLHYCAKTSVEDPTCSSGTITSGTSIPPAYAVKGKFWVANDLEFVP